MRRGAIDISEKRLIAFCKRWQIIELALFGSVLRDDFRPDSDVDFLVTYAPNKRRLPWGEQPEAEEMAALLGRKIDWVTRSSVETGRNPIFKREVLKTAEVIYAENRETFA